MILIISVEQQRLCQCSNNHTTIIANAIRVLYCITKWPHGAQAALDANMHDHVAELLKLSNADITTWTCKMLENLTSHEPPPVVVLQVGPCVQLGSLLRCVSVILCGQNSDIEVDTEIWRSSWLQFMHSVIFPVGLRAPKLPLMRTFSTTSWNCLNQRITTCGIGLARC